MYAIVVASVRYTADPVLRIRVLLSWTQVLPFRGKRRAVVCFARRVKQRLARVLLIAWEGGGGGCGMEGRATGECEEGLLSCGSD